ncbi:ATP-binding protein [Streptosporangium sp. NPDC023615]|uniref:ATP-binding protein n=1 Tax=Streptosporangium sp. NPDC023615 TaxID=3154794 RepID=UPI00343E071D
MEQRKLAEMFLDNTHESVRQARHETREALGADHCLLADVVQVVSELLANAVEHSDRGPVDDLIGLTLTDSADSVQVEVSDGGSATRAPHIPHDRPAGAGRGRGLLIVDRISGGRWGTREHGRGLGRTVWCAVPYARPSPPGAETAGAGHRLPGALPAGRAAGPGPVVSGPVVCGSLTPGPFAPAPLTTVPFTPAP